MSGTNTSYPAPGYPASLGFQTTGSYPSSGAYPNDGYPYPSTGGYPNSGAACPKVLDARQTQEIPGYERLTLQKETVKPPSTPDHPTEAQNRVQPKNLPSLTDEDAREAVIQYVSDHCCYRSNAAKNMIIHDITMMSAFHYKLETFGEKRELVWQFEPYKGQAIDGPMNGPAPQAWDVVATPPAYFKDGTSLKREVPHTAFIKSCQSCMGNAKVRCDYCQGIGRNQCTWCRGRGRRSKFDNNEECTFCNGTGTSGCSRCNSTGHVTCKCCDGRGQLKGYIELTVTWTNHFDEYISETSSLPKHLVGQVTGQTVFEEECPKVHPIIHTSDKAVRNASSEYVDKHNTAFPNERIIMQRHCLRLIPIGEVNYTWKEKTGLYYVYGFERKVYFKNYPQKCCTII